MAHNDEKTCEIMGSVAFKRFALQFNCFIRPECLLCFLTATEAEK